MSSASRSAALFRGQIAPQQVEVTTQGIKVKFYLLQAAEHGGPAGVPSAGPPDLAAIQESARRAVRARLRGRRLLWVDDNPENNTSERAALDTLGVDITIARTTSEALEAVSKNDYNLIITDFRRFDDERAAYTLLDRLKQPKQSPAVIVYSGSATEEQVREVKRRGAIGETNNPTRLLDMAVEALES